MFALHLIRNDFFKIQLFVFTVEYIFLIIIKEFILLSWENITTTFKLLLPFNLDIGVYWFDFEDKWHQWCYS